eukprot:Clim_evm50s251 gene=Clim_evmTU50s251
MFALRRFGKNSSALQFVRPHILPAQIRFAGHSKWHNIQHRKGKQDAIKSKINAKHANFIRIAASNNPDPSLNANLQDAIGRAKSEGVPGSVIEKALQSASKEQTAGAGNYQNFVLEARGPGGMTCMIECLSDNRKRALQNIATVFGKFQGTVGSGTAAYNFQHCGVIRMECGLQGSDPTFDRIFEVAVEAGAEDVVVEDDGIPVEGEILKEELPVVCRIQCERTSLREIARIVENALGKEPKSVAMEYLPLDLVEVNEADVERIGKLMDMLDDDLDTAKVHHNLA